MYPWMLPGMAGTGGGLSLLSMMQGGRSSFDDRSDQQGNANQPDVGNTMGPPQGGQGGPDRNPMSPYDPNTVVRPGEQQPAAGWQASPWMRALNGIGRGNQRGGQQMSLLGLSMLQPRPPAHTGPYPWI